MAALGLGTWFFSSPAAEVTVWWLFNDSPPLVEAGVPAGPVRGPVRVSVTVRPAGRVAVVDATLDGAPLADPIVALAAGTDSAAPTRIAAVVQTPQTLWSTWWALVRSGRPLASADTFTVEIDTAVLPDGRRTVGIEVADVSRRRNRGAVEVALEVDNTPPKLAFDGAPPRLRAGGVTWVRVGTNEPAALQAAWGADPFPLIPGPTDPTGGRTFVALVSPPVIAPAGEVVLRAAGTDAAGNAADASLSVAVDPVTLPRQALAVPPSLAPLATGPVATAEAAQVAALTARVRPERLWKGEFVTPLPPSFARTTGFGDRRDYADGHVAHHAGYDVAALARTPVGAAADGVVVFAGPLPQRGNTVVLDHGWGIYTLYAHLSEMAVQPDEATTQRQMIGRVGNTGLSTGPHLHWEVRLRGQPVDPDSWLAVSRDLP